MRTKKTRNKNSSAIKDRFLWLLIPLSAVILAVIINNFVILSAIVPSASMADTIEKGSLVISSRLAYASSQIERGDIVIFRHVEIDERYVIKRVIALPGESVELREGRVYVNGDLLEEDYISLFSSDDFPEVTVPYGCYFLLGDNRCESFDSRFWNNPFVKAENVFARAELTLFPKVKKLK